jgi:hypothetical protein
LQIHACVGLRAIVALLTPSFRETARMNRQLRWQSDTCLLNPPPWADEISAVGSKSPRGPGHCRFDGRIVQSACMPKERFPPRVFSVKTFPQLRVI